MIKRLAWYEFAPDTEKDYAAISSYTLFYALHTKKYDRRQPSY